MDECVDVKDLTVEELNSLSKRYLKENIIIHDELEFRKRKDKLISILYLRFKDKGNLDKFIEFVDSLDEFGFDVVEDLNDGNDRSFKI